MKTIAIVSERGTIAIPEAIRKMSGIHPGDLIEVKPEKNRIVLRHLTVRCPQEENIMTGDEWERFDSLVHTQLDKGQFSSYTNLKDAKLHSKWLRQQ